MTSFDMLVQIIIQDKEFWALTTVIENLLYCVIDINIFVTVLLCLA